MNLYEVLHISQDAPEEIIKMAYKGLAQKYHPDRYKGHDANEIMIKIREAYETLIDPIKRKNYDQFLAKQESLKQQEFLRSQKAAFEQQNRSHSNTDSAKQNQKGDYKNFKVNISIDIPSDFSINLLIDNFRKWLISKKSLFTRIGKACIALVLIVIVGSLLESYISNSSREAAADYAAALEDEYRSTSTESYDEEIYDEQNYDEQNYDEESYGEQNYAAIDTSNAANDAADSALAAANSAMSAAVDAELAVKSAPDLNNNLSEIQNSANEVFVTFRESGLMGVEEFIKNCYAQNKNIMKCMYLDHAGKYIHESGVALGHSAYEFFDTETLTSRMINSFYAPNRIDSDVGAEHYKQTRYHAYKAMEKIMLDELNESN